MDNSGNLPKIIHDMVQRIVEGVHPHQVILFGSHARGRAGLDSDVDLLVVTPIIGSKRKKTVDIYGLLAGVGLPKDVIVVTPQEVEKYRNIPGTLIRTAFREGKLLYEHST